jgi:hypothetical protein
MLIAICWMASPVSTGGMPQGRAADVSATAQSSSLPAVDLTGFTKIFDGKTLENWDGDPTYWTVVNETLVGTITPETLLKENSWIVWRGGLVEDFELVLDYRASSKANSGVGYRLNVLEEKPHAVRGPQADIDGGGSVTGICYEENGRRILASRGQSVWVDSGGKPRVIFQFADAGELQSTVRQEDWNRYRLVVRGRHAKHYLNGFLMSEIDDHDERNRMHRGLLGVQVHVGPPMKIEYRNIYFKHLGSPPHGPVNRGSVVYRPGSLVEFDHSAAYQHLVQQTAELTAPITTKRIDGQDELVVVTRDLGGVRHDLENVPILAMSKPLNQNEKAYDLVVASGNTRVRVPNAGLKIVGLPWDMPYHVHLKWNRGKTCYELVDLQPAQASGKRD